MANVRDSDTSLWLHNKLGTSNDSWISGSICSQLNKEVLRNIKECFPDLQTQVKLKLLLSFFHIPRRLVEEWKTELDGVIEVAGLDTELWVSMLAESMKTFPATSSLNTEISDYEDTRPIFTEMVNDLRKLVAKHSDLGMLPLECQYLNKNALVSVVGQQPNPVKHFTIKRKPKSATLRTELLHKSADAQSSLKKASAPTIPLRSRGMPRKMTDTTPLKGIPSRMPTSGFRSPNVNPNNQQRPNLSRTPAGRKDGGIKLIEFTEQPLGYAAAKKRKREQQLEEQARKHEQKAAAAAAADNSSPTSNSVPSNNAATASVPSTTTTNSFEIKTEPTSLLNRSQSNNIDDGVTLEHKEDIKPEIVDNIASSTHSESISTPEYAPPSLSYTQTAPGGLIDNVGTHSSLEVTKPITSNDVTASSLQQQTQQQKSGNNNNNSNSMNHPHKRIKQEIEIKSEEILVPANIKVEKLELKTQPVVTQTSTQTLVQRIQQKQQQQQQHQPQQAQRVIIQQQQSLPILQHIQTQTNQQQYQQQTHQQQQTQQTSTQHVIIRTSPQTQKQALAVRQQNTASTPVKMEKLEIKPLVRSTIVNQPGTILTQQQPMRPAATNSSNPLANLPNNISVKITSTKTGKVTQTQQTLVQSTQQQQQQQQTHQQQQQQPQQQQQILINSSTPVILASTPTQTAAMRQKQLSTSAVTAQNAIPQTAQAIKSMPLSQLKNATNSGPVIISQTIIQPAKRANNATAVNQQPSQQAQTQPTQIIQQTHTQQHQPSNPNTTTQYILTQQQPTQQQQQHQQTLSTLTAYTQNRQQNTYTTTSQTPQTPTSTKILLKTSPSSGVVIRQQQQQQQQQQQSQQTVGNPPPLIATATSTSSASTLLNIQNVQLPNRPVTIQPASQAAQQQHLQAQLQQQQHTLVSNNTATQQPKLTQVLMQPSGSTGTATVTTTPANANLKNKTIILTQKGVILRNIVGDMYEQIPISNVSGLQTLGTGSTTLMTTAAGPPGLVKTTTVSALPQTQTITLQQQPQSQVTKTQLPTLIPTQQHMIVQQQPQATASLITNPTQQTIIRPVMTNVQSGLTALPGGLTLIQRPGQQPQLVQVQTTPVQQAQQQTQIQRTIITQPAIQQTTQQLRPQQIVLQQKPAATQRLITSTQQIQLQQNAAGGIQRIIQLPQQQQQTQQATQTQQQQQTQPQQQTAPQRKGLSLSNEHVHKAHEMFRKANRVSRPDKALILGFMAGLRENPRPNSENVIVIKLGETEEKVQQEDGITALCLVESHIRLDYNTGEWKTFQNYRRLDQSTQSSTENASSSNNVMQSQNSVVI
ncbi:negative elongation factor A [Glossina fuscipes]|uniref:Negative elongation factor A n=1 Tax=Glossina fuscipes TaxID=7396 RepID=A0A9C5Z0S8_9MUSC|nr:negative elongation factor A [Glossina fuscipes]